MYLDRLNQIRKSCSELAGTVGGLLLVLALCALLLIRSEWISRLMPGAGSQQDCNERLLQAAMDGNATGIARALAAGAAVNCRDFVGETPLIWAARTDSTDAVMKLLGAGADVSVVSQRKSTALSAAVCSDKSPIARLLLEHRADPNQAAPGASTPLFIAMLGGKMDAAKLLLENGADPNLPGVDGATSLALLKSMSPQRADIRELMLARGAVK